MEVLGPLSYFPLVHHLWNPKPMQLLLMEQVLADLLGPRKIK